jgi:hypothetical protein
MKSLSVGLTESQLDHLRTIKQKYGISMGGFIRVLLKTDMERPLIPEYTVVDERSEITTTKTRRRVMATMRPVSPERAALMAELNLALSRRRKKVEQAIVVSPVRA